MEMEGFDATRIIACALRPQASWLHACTLAGFVLAAWHVSPRPSRVRPRSSEGA